MEVDEGLDWSFSEARSFLDEWHRRASEAKPFLKWAGGKRLFLARYGDMVPVPTGRFVEPFIGSGAVFFHVSRRAGRPLAARLGDYNGALIECYLQVQEDPDIVWDTLQSLVAGFRASRDKKAYYERTRRTYNSLLPRVDAGYFVFLNRTCWNGLYRVNKRGEFNVPMGKTAEKKSLHFPSRDDLLNAGVALSEARIRATTWEHLLALVEDDDFVFLDPPYYSDAVRRDDSKYSVKPFTFEDHEKLADHAARLAARGIGFLLTNSAEPEMVRLYESRGLRASLVDVPRAINSDLSGRGAVRELLVTPL
jgi:DNA adenine methylase